MSSRSLSSVCRTIRTENHRKCSPRRVRRRFGKWFPIPVPEACCYSAAQKSPVACYGNKGDCSHKVKLLRKTSEISQSTCGVRGPKSERHFIAAEIDEFSEYCKRNQQKSQIQSILSTIVGRRTFSPWAARCNNISWDRGPLFFPSAPVCKHRAPHEIPFNLPN